MRFAVYGLLGWMTDRAFTSVTSYRRTREPRLPARSAVLVPLYGLLQPIYEPVHDRLRGVPLAVRAVAYGVGILMVEYATGRLLRRAFGHAPWDYRGARWSVDGLTRLDYLPLWAVAGVALERVHDRLVGPPSATRG